MYFTKVAVLIGLAASAVAAPTPAANEKRALTFKKYNDFQISGGTAGNALAEAQKAFPLPNNLSTVSGSDLAIMNAARQTAEAAETNAFNSAVQSASGGAANALQNGKIKNKVLKLYLETSALQVEQAQGKNNQAKIDAEQKKLDTNVATDKKNAGATSQAVNFTGDVQPGN